MKSKQETITSLEADKNNAESPELKKSIKEKIQIIKEGKCVTKK
jgi:hypothetical protein